jgi:enterobactin synthetase component D
MLNELFAPIAFEWDDKQGFFTKVNCSYSEQTSAYLFTCQFNIENYHIDLYRQFNIDLPEHIQRSVEKRQAEFLAGRYAANVVLNKLGFHSYIIRSGKNREPLWPQGITASISHTDSHAMCIAALSSNIRFLGIDIEHWLSKETALQIDQSIITEAEKKTLSMQSLSHEQLVTIAFSSKEALFKAIYPDVNTYLDFNTSVINHISGQCISLNLVLPNEIKAQELSAINFNCSYFIYNTYVACLILKPFE